MYSRVMPILPLLTNSITTCMILPATPELTLVDLVLIFRMQSNVVYSGENKKRLRIAHSSS